MKHLFFILFLCIFWGINSNLNANPLSSSRETHIQADVTVTTSLITIAPCEGGGYSATIRVDIYINNGFATLLAASQTVDIPCGTVINKMTRPSFDKNVNKKLETKGVLSVIDYLNKKDKDHAIFQKIKTSIYESVHSIKDQ